MKCHPKAEQLNSSGGSWHENGLERDLSLELFWLWEAGVDGHAYWLEGLYLLCHPRAEQLKSSGGSCHENGLERDVPLEWFCLWEAELL